MRRGAKKKNTQTKPPQTIEECHNIDIQNIIEADDERLATIISQLEDFYPDYQDQLYKSFLIFYLKAIGFDNFEKLVSSESVQDVPKLIDEIQKLYQKKPELYFNDERVRLLIDNRAQGQVRPKIILFIKYKDRIISFFYDLYSNKTEIIQKDLRFNEILIKQFQGLMQIKLRQSRTATVHLICLIGSAIIKNIQDSQKQEYMDLIQDIWAQILKEGIYDVDSAIRQQTIKFLMKCFAQIPHVFNQPKYFDVIVETFQQQYYEMREIGLDNLINFLQQSDNEIEDITRNLFTYIQIDLIKLINLEKNESILLKGFQVLEQVIKKLGGSFLQEQTIKSVRDYLLWSNYTVRYEAGKILNHIAPIKQLKTLAKFTLDIQHHDLKEISEYMIIPFINTCHEILNPQSYVSTLLNNNDKMRSSDEELFETLLYLFAGALKFSVEYKSKTINFIHLTFENEKIDEIITFQEKSSEYIFDHLTSIQYKFFGHDKCFKAYLYLLMQLQFDFVISRPELKQNLLKILSQTFIKSKDNDEIAYCARLIQILTQQDNINFSFIKEQPQINELIEYIQQQMKKDAQNPILIHKTTSILSANLCPYTSLFEIFWYQNTPSELIIELLGGALKNSFKNYILNTTNKNFEEYLEIRKFFFQKAFQGLSQIVVFNKLVYILSITNNDKCCLNKLHEDLSQEQYQLLSEGIDRFILRDLGGDDYRFSLVSQLEKEKIELLKNIFDLLRCSSSIVFAMGLRVMKEFLELSLKSNDLVVQSRVMEILQVILNKSLDERYKPMFWKAVMEMVELSKDEEFQQKVSGLVLEMYLSAGQQFQQQTEALKQQYFQFFVELIQKSNEKEQVSFYSMWTRHMLHFLNNVIAKKVFSRLQIDGSVAKKMCIYFEQHRSKNVRSEYAKIQSHIQNRLRAASNLRESEIKKYLKEDEVEKEDEAEEYKEEEHKRKKKKSKKEESEEEYVVEKRKKK